MTNLQWWVAGAAGLWLGVCYAYVLVMAAKSAMEKGTLTLFWKVVLILPAMIGLVLDLLFNYTFGFMFGAWPRPVLFSSTVQHHYRHSDGWRWRLANFWRRNLNVFDEFHIRP